jgi:hypothetical protein
MKKRRDDEEIVYPPKCNNELARVHGRTGARSVREHMGSSAHAACASFFVPTTNRPTLPLFTTFQRGLDDIGVAIGTCSLFALPCLPAAFSHTDHMQASSLTSRYYGRTRGSSDKEVPATFSRHPSNVCCKLLNVCGMSPFPKRIPR